jgi:hypothetical protein
MRRPRNYRVGSLIVIATVFTSAVGKAADSPAEKLLSKHGLKRIGSLYILDAEADAKKKLEEVRALSKDWNSARVQQALVGTAKDHQSLVQDLSGQINQLRAELTAVNQQMARVPRWRNRIGSNLAQEEHAELSAYRNQLNLALNQQNAFLNQVKSHPPDPKLQQKLESDVQSRHDRYLQEARDLGKLVQATKEKYASLTKMDEIKKALDSLGSAVRAKPKLGPSHEFLAIAKLVEKLQKETDESPADSKGRPARKPKHGSRSKERLGNDSPASAVE